MSSKPPELGSKILEELMNRVYSLGKNEDESSEERWDQEQLRSLEQDIIGFFNVHRNEIDNRSREPSHDGATILHAVCKLDLARSLKWLLSTGGANPNVRDGKRFTPFILRQCIMRQDASNIFVN